jgi:hypothetical protein
MLNYSRLLKRKFLPMESSGAFLFNSILSIVMVRSKEPMRWIAAWWVIA